MAKQTKNFLKVFYYTHKFLMKMKFIHDYKNIFNLTKYHFYLIGDKAYYPFNQKRRRMLILIKNLFLVNFFSWLHDHKIKLSVFSPESLTVILWKIFIFILIVIQLFLIPFKISYNIQYSEGMNDLDTFIIWILFFDIFISINTGYYEEGQIMIDRKKILFNYIKH